MRYSRYGSLFPHIGLLWLLWLLLGAPHIARAQVGIPWALGSNSKGQLGDGTTTDASLPVHPTSITDVVQIVGGGAHSLALLNDGTVWAWGWNSLKQLGDGTTTDSAIPIQVAGMTGVTSIAAGEFDSFAIKSDGSLWVWGVGLDSPVQISAITGAVQIASGGGNGHLHYTVLKTDGTLWAWGWLQGDDTPSPILGISGIVQVSAGGDHELALKSDGTVWARGSNINGQLGDGTNVDKSSFVQVTGLTDVVHIEAGYFHSLAVKSDGTVWAWGGNSASQLGDGTDTDRTIPVQVAGLLGVVQVAGGFQSTLALKADGTVWHWGEGNSTPTQIPNLTQQTQIDAGKYHFLSLQATVQPTKISPIVVTQQYGTSTIPAKLVNSKNNSPLRNRLLGFSLDGYSLGSSKTAASGVATATIPNATSYGLGDHTLAVSFAGDRLYTSSSRIITLTITKANTNFAPLSTLIGVFGNSRLLSATLRRQSDGTRLIHQPVTIKIDGNIVGTATTDSHGTATINYKLDEGLTVGTHIYSAEFGGDDLHNASSVQGSIVINPADTSIAPLSNLVGVYGNTRVLSAVLKRRSDNLKLANKTITFSIDGVAVGTGTTDSTGKATFSYKLEDNLTPGSHSYSAEFGGDTNYGAFTTAASLTLNPASTTLTEQDITGIAGRNVTFYATLKRLTDGSKVSNRTIQFTLDGVSIGSANTVSGIAKLLIVLPKSTTKGIHSLGVKFEADGYYKSSSYSNATLTVN